MNVVRRNVQGVNAYVAGKPIEEVKRQLGLKDVIKLASNENPLGPSPRALAAIRKSIAQVNRYPDSQSFYLKRKIAKCSRVPESCVVVGNGSDELIDVIIKTFVEDDENIVTADLTFLEYEIIAKVNNRQVITAPLKYFKYDLDALKKRVNAKTKLVFIANPNNPTGTYVTKHELDEFLSGLPEHVLVVLDEAYDAFIDVNDFPDALALGRKNLIVLRTMSKAYGLAGLRIGYAVADSALVPYMERVRQPFNVNLIAQAAAIAALDDAQFLKKTRKVAWEGKKYLYGQLGAMGVSFVPSVANFILIDTGRDCVSVFKEMLRSGVIVRDMSQYGLTNYIRVTIGTRKENEKFVRVFKKVINNK